jgi:hypothetical protein
MHLSHLNEYSGGFPYRCVFKKFGFQHREGWMKAGNEDRSVVMCYVRTGSLCFIQDSMPNTLLVMLRDEKTSIEATRR